jgi:hypothetical protein
MRSRISFILQMISTLAVSFRNINYIAETESINEKVSAIYIII